jgi:hypothetical protein
VLAGEKINLKIAEKEDGPLLKQWRNNVEFAGNYQHFPTQVSGKKE